MAPDMPPAGESLALIDAEDAGRIRTTPTGFVSDHMYCPANRVVMNWHNGVHEGAYATCTEQPCNAVQKVCD